MVAAGAGQHRRLHALGMMRGETQASMPPNERPTRIALPASVASMTASDIGNVVVERVGGDVRRPVGLAVAARIEGDAAEALAEIGQLRLVDARVHDAPGRQEHHGLRAVAVDLVVDLDAVALDEPFLVGSLARIDITSSLTQLPQ